jgi:phosphoglycolate phosphatase-like HAD superfamily hydrolase
MVGDTVVDIAAGRAAGARAIGVTFGFCGPAIVEAGPDAVVDALAEVPALVAGW